MGCFKEALETFIQAKEYNPIDNTCVDIAFQIKTIQMLTKNFEDKKNVIYKDVGYPSGEKNLDFIFFDNLNFY